MELKLRTLIAMLCIACVQNVCAQITLEELQANESKYYHGLGCRHIRESIGRCTRKPYQPNIDDRILTVRERSSQRLCKNEGDNENLLEHDTAECKATTRQ